MYDANRVLFSSLTLALELNHKQRHREGGKEGKKSLICPPCVEKRNLYIPWPHKSVCRAKFESGICKQKLLFPIVFHFRFFFFGMPLKTSRAPVVRKIHRYEIEGPYVTR
ncbi:hypothetical protein TNCV_2321591 [Trichonephila clavipes]|nr:hypothetical protein TNCV_2321591 [Trichonephila clavipes]